MNFIAPDSLRNDKGGGEVRTAPLRNRRDDQSDMDTRSGPSGTHSCSNTTRMASQRQNGSPNMRLNPTLVGIPLDELPKARRRKWSKEDNKDIYRAYFAATNCEKDKAGYRKRMLIEWKKIRISSDLNEQQVANQLYAIRTKKLLTESEIEEVKKEIQNKQDIQALPQNTPQLQTEMITENRMDDNIKNVTETTNVSKTQPEETDHIIDDFERYLTIYKNTSIEVRPKLKRLKPGYKMFTLLNKINTHISNKTITELNTLEDIHVTIYCAALAIVEETCKNFKKNCQVRGEKKKEPKWKQRIENKIKDIRSTITKIIDWQKHKSNKKNTKHVESQLKARNISINNRESNQELIIYIETLKQKIAMYGKRLRRYNTSNKRKDDNRRFKQSEKLFYNNLSNTNIRIQSPPTENDLTFYWENMWKNKGNHNTEAEWLKSEKYTNEHIEQMEDYKITLDELKQAVKNTMNWKSPGPDHIHNFWWKYLTSVHPHITTAFNKLLNDPNSVPPFLAKGITYLIPKSKETQLPKNYRPITCLNTIYKLFTSIIATKIYTHVETYSIVTDQQKGCRKGTPGCKEQLWVDAVITQHAKHTNRNITVAWIDYQKAFDSVPHSWLIAILNLYKINKNIIKILQSCMEHWETTLQLHTENTTLITKKIKIESGIYQGDSLSPLWFILSLNPLSKALNKMKTGYKIKANTTENTFNHLFYVDDLKLYAQSESDINRLIKTTEEFSSDIKMNFGIDKCAKLVTKKGKIISEQVHDDLNFTYLTEENSYKYLGYNQQLIRNEKQIKVRLINTFMKRVETLLRTELTGKNKIKGINTWAIPILIYSFGVINWNNTELEDINRKIRVIMTKYRFHHPKSATERIYLPRKEG